MKPRNSRPDTGQIVKHKVKVLRAYLVRYGEITTPSFNVGSSFNRDGVRGDGSRLAPVTQWLKPEILLCTSRGDTKAEFITLPDATCVDATPEALGMWLQAHDQQTGQESISDALRVLQSAGSRLSSRTEQSDAAKAVNVLRRLLVKREAPAA